MKTRSGYLLYPSKGRRHVKICIQGLTCGDLLPTHCEILIQMKGSD